MHSINDDIAQKMKCKKIKIKIKWTHWMREWMPKEGNNESDKWEVQDIWH
jgi:hypothetical protein